MKGKKIISSLFFSIPKVNPKKSPLQNINKKSTINKQNRSFYSKLTKNNNSKKFKDLKLNYLSNLVSKVKLHKKKIGIVFTISALSYSYNRFSLYLVKSKFREFGEYLLEGKIELARDTLLTLCRSHENHSKIMVIIGLIDDELNDVDNIKIGKIERYLEILSENDPLVSFTMTLYIIFYLIYKKGERDLAKYVTDYLVNTVDSFSDFSGVIIHAYILLNDLDAAEQFLNKVERMASTSLARIKISMWYLGLLFSKHDVKEALIVMNKLLNNPHVPVKLKKELLNKVAIMTVNFQYKKGEEKELIEIYLERIKSGDIDEEVKVFYNIRLLFLYKSINEYDSALYHYKMAESSDMPGPLRLFMHQLVSEIHYEKGEYKDALEENDKAKNFPINPTRVKILMKRGDILLKLNKKDEALKAFKNATMINNDNALQAISFFYIATIHEERNETRNTIDCFKKAIEFSVKSGKHELKINSYIGLIRPYFYEKKFEEARKYCNLALNKKSVRGIFVDESMLLFYRFYTYLYQGMEDLALRDLSRLKEQKGSDEREKILYIYAAGDYYKSKGNIDEALKIYKSLPKNVRDEIKIGINNSMADIYINRGMYTEAHRIFEESCTLQGDNNIKADLLYKEAMLYLSEGKREIASEKLDTAIKYEKSMVRASIMKSKYYTELGDLESSIKELKKAISIAKGRNEEVSTYSFNKEAYLRLALTKRVNLLIEYFKYNDFFQALYNNDLDGVKNHLNSENIDARDKKGKTPLIISIENNNIEMMKEIIKNNPNYHIMDNDYRGPLMIAMNTNNNEAIYHLLLNRRKVNCEYINSILQSYFSQYKDYHREEVDKINLVNHVTTILSHYNIALITLEEVNKYFGHIFDERGNIDEKNIELWASEKYLPLLIRLYVNILAKIEHDDIKFPKSYTEQYVKESIIEEISVAMETLQLRRESLTIHKGKFDNIFKKKFINAHVKNIVKKIIDLKDDESLCYNSGFTEYKTGHTLYVNFIKNRDSIDVRIDNLGSGSDQHFSIFKANNKKYIAPCYLKSFKNSEINEDTLSTYVEEIIAAKFERRKVATGKIYCNVCEYHDNSYFEEAQTVGNCVVKNYNIGRKIRLGKELYDWLYKKELEVLIAFKIELKKSDMQRLVSERYELIGLLDETFDTLPVIPVFENQLPDFNKSSLTNSKKKQDQEQENEQSFRL